MRLNRRQLRETRETMKFDSSKNNNFMPTSKELRTCKEAFDDIRVFAGKTPNRGNEVILSCNGIKISINDDRKKHESQTELKERCENVLFSMLLRN